MKEEKGIIKKGSKNRKGRDFRFTDFQNFVIILHPALRGITHSLVLIILIKNDKG